MIQTIFLSIIFFASGIMHLMDPYAFANAIPLFIPLKLEIIYMTGILELMLSFGLLFKKTRKPSLNTVFVYLILLIPIHIHVALFRIPFLGLTGSLQLWARLLLQFVLVAWTYKLRKR